MNWRSLAYNIVLYGTGSICVGQTVVVDDAAAICSASTTDNTAFFPLRFIGGSSARTTGTGSTEESVQWNTSLTGVYDVFVANMTGAINATVNSRFVEVYDGATLTNSVAVDDVYIGENDGGEQVIIDGVPFTLVAEGVEFGGSGSVVFRWTPGGSILGFFDAVAFVPVSEGDDVNTDILEAIAWQLQVLILAACWILGGVIVRLLFLFKNQGRLW